VVALVNGLIDPYMEEGKEEEEAKGEEAKEKTKKGGKEEGLVMDAADCYSRECRTSQ